MYYTCIACMITVHSDNLKLVYRDHTITCIYRLVIETCVTRVNRP